MYRHFQSISCSLLFAALLSACQLGAGSSTPSTAITYRASDGRQLQATYAADSVRLQQAGQRTLHLQRAISASGARYTSAAKAGSAEWWEHQGSACLRIDDKEVFCGQPQLPQPAATGAK